MCQTFHRHQDRSARGTRRQFRHSRGFVERLAAEGAKVIACGRNEATLQELKNENPIIETFPCDITI
jgi:hypothetical protein